MTAKRSIKNVTTINDLVKQTSDTENIPTEKKETQNNKLVEKVQNDKPVEETQNEEQVNDLKALKEKFKNVKSSPAKVQMGFYLTPENAKRMKAIKGYGMRSQLVNELLDLYFSQE